MDGDSTLIVIGASTGGIEALRTLLPSLCDKFYASICICQHMERSSRLDYQRIFPKVSGYETNEAQDKDELKPGGIYFAPPGYHLYVEKGGYLSLSLDEPVNWSRPSIDVLFESAAIAYQSRVCGIVLTGGNGDGANGIREIKRRGGLTIVQDPQEALADIMPRLSLETGCVDQVLKLSEIGSFLSRRMGGTAFLNKGWVGL